MKIEIGKVLKAQGIKGEIKIYCSSDDSSMLKSVKSIYLDSKEYTIDKLRTDGKFAYIHLAGVCDRNAAEMLRDEVVFANKDDLYLASGRYFIDDLIGCEVSTDSGKLLGKIQDVLQYGAADVIVCSGEKDCSFPFLKDVVVSVDTQRLKMVVDSTRFEQVVCYED